ncbi:MAG TPA: cobalt ABC transporter ATP-binding protein, partial [Solibacterales bacterium]|nr:cobalt ABC transporter ATP-binding protein [Bryobacterales bacterium]
TYENGAQALHGVDFDLLEGESVALLGANGSGKTTFVLHLNGLLNGQGSIEIAGMPITPDNLPAIRRKVGMVFQDADEQLFMPTLLEDVAYGPANLGFPPEEAVHKAIHALESVGLSGLERRAPYQLSAGEKRRAAIAGVLAMEPEILILDEPTTYLDPPAQRELIQLLSQLPQAKVIVTHDASFALATARRAVFFRNGTIGGTGPVDEILTRFDWTLQPRSGAAR